MLPLARGEPCSPLLRLGLLSRIIQDAPLLLRVATSTAAAVSRAILRSSSPPATTSPAIHALAFTGSAAGVVTASSTASLERALGECRIKTRCELLLVKAETLGPLGTLLCVIVLLDTEALGAIGTFLGLFVSNGRGETEGIVGGLWCRLGGGICGRFLGLVLGSLCSLGSGLFAGGGGLLVVGVVNFVFLCV